MSKIVRTAGDLMYPFVFIFGWYVIMHGHLTPGGGFQGGAVVATGAALIIVAYSYTDVARMIKRTILMFQESGGLVLFIAAGLGGMVLGFPFFYNWLANSGSLFGMSVVPGPNPGELNTAGFLPLMNIAVGTEVWGGLTMVILYMLSGVEKEEI